ncbi:fibronectin type III domain-containing protein [Tenacibaculum sp.]|uniref:fibronectin type III domain-containing protein n=1 Tax=Tenacibaculum sp. TaxID=1906242 RepID=UPI003AA7C833
MTKTLKKICLASFLLLFISCNEDDVVKEIKEVTFSEFTITAESGIDYLILDWEDVTASNEQKVSYDVYLNDVLKIADLDVSNYKIDGLEADTNYPIKLVVKDESENSKESIVTFKTTSKPAPSIVAIESKDITYSSFTINWTPATISGDKGILYDVYLNKEIVASNLDVLTYTFSDLNANTTYNLKVVAKSTEFETTSTQSIEVFTKENPIPSTVDITVKNVGITEFTINWTAATISGDQGILYDIYLNEEITASNLDALTYTFSSLSANTSFDVKVIAKSIEFETISTQTTKVVTNEAPSPNDFILNLLDIKTTSATVSWSSLTIDGAGGVLADIYLNDTEISTGVTSSGWALTALNPNTEYTIKIVARSTEYGTTLVKEINLITESLPTTFEVTSAKLYARTTGTFASPPRITIRFSNRDFLDGIVLNGTSYLNFTYAGEDGIIISLTDDEYDTLSTKTTKEGTANFTENGTSDSKIFTYTVVE